MSPTREERSEEAVVKIKHYMETTGSTQYEVAAKIGAPPQTVNRWLNGKAEVSNSYFKLLQKTEIFKN